MNFLTDKNTNSLATILSLLKVRYTAGYTDRYFNEHPFKYSLYGLSTMLTHYGIQNIGIKVTNKKDIHYLETPFIAHVGNSFVAVEKSQKKKSATIGIKKESLLLLIVFWIYGRELHLYLKPMINPLSPIINFIRRRNCWFYFRRYYFCC